MEIIVLPGLKNLAAHPRTFTHCDGHQKPTGNWYPSRAALGNKASWSTLSMAGPEQGKAISLPTFLFNTGIGAQGFPTRKITALI